MKVIQEDLSKWKKILFSQVVVLNVFKLVILPKLSYGLDGILIKTPTDFFMELEKLIFKYIWES